MYLVKSLNQPCKIAITNTEQIPKTTSPVAKAIKKFLRFCFINILLSDLFYHKCESFSIPFDKKAVYARLTAFVFCVIITTIR